MTPAIYVASRASIPERGAMWRRCRSRGARIVSSWIDEDGPGQTPSMTELWERIGEEVSSADVLVLYAERGDFPLKGALVEAGIALSCGIPVRLVLPGLTDADVERLVGSWAKHRLVSVWETVEDAVSVA